MAETPHVALIVETSSHYGCEVLIGITRYLQSHTPWSVFLEQRELWTLPPAWLKSWHGDGVICRKTTPALARQLHRRGIPLVDLNDRATPIASAPRIESDQRAVGVAAADHLLDRGFMRTAFCGFSDQAWSIERRAGFAGRLREHGRSCEVWESPWIDRPAHRWEAEQARIAKWIASLAHPVGLMACNDVRGQHVLDACQRAKIAVPEQVAVVGVDNDSVLCNLCRPPLSSVIPNAERVGYEAAALLDQLIANRGLNPPLIPATMNIPPVGVHIRQSTDVLAIDDPAVAAALRYIREKACEPCSVEDVLQHVPLSRSSLERKFRHYIGRSLKAEIRGVQLKRVLQLLADTDLPLSRIATLAGFDHTEYLSVVFKRELGTTPGQYRAKVTAGSSEPGLRRERTDDRSKPDDSPRRAAAPSPARASF